MISHPQVHYGINAHTHRHMPNGHALAALSHTHTHKETCTHTCIDITYVSRLSCDSRVVYVELLFRRFYAVNVPWLTFCIINIFLLLLPLLLLLLLLLLFQCLLCCCCFATAMCGLRFYNLIETDSHGRRWLLCNSNWHADTSLYTYIETYLCIDKMLVYTYNCVFLFLVQGVPADMRH